MLLDSQELLGAIPDLFCSVSAVSIVTRNSASPHEIPFPGSSLGSRQDPWALPFAPRVVFEASTLGRETGNAERMFFLGNGQRETWSFPGVCESSSQTLNWVSPDWIIRI